MQQLMLSIPWHAVLHLLLQLSIAQQAAPLTTIQKCNYDQVCKFYE
jgi:hypothetical protein